MGDLTSSIYVAEYGGAGLVLDSAGNLYAGKAKASDPKDYKIIKIAGAIHL